MANDAFSLSVATAASRTDILAEGAFVALLLLVFVTLTPFQPPADVTVFGDTVVAGSGAGYMWRQIAYLSVFAYTLLCAARKNGLDLIRAVPPVLALLLLWCMASSLWAAAPGITVRRAGLAIVIVASTLLSIDTIGGKRALTLWRIVLGGVLIVNWLSIPFIAEARHLSGELDPALVGNWRGLYGHKNIAGAVSAITAMLFLFSFLDRRRWLDFGIFLLAVGFVVMSRSKFSLALLPAALTAGMIYRWMWRRDLDRVIALVVAGLAAVLGALAFYLSYDAILAFLNDPSELTGRTTIWQAEFAYIRDHLLLGAGFGSFANTGNFSPLHDYMSQSWVGVVSHGHSGYLQLLVTVGAVGILLAIFSLIIGPLITFLRQPHSNVAALSVLFALFIFGLLHNVLETDFMESDSASWVSFLIMLGLLRSLAAQKTQ
jgi:O-antigen ligase